MKAIADIIAEAREYLEKDGWIQGELRNDEGVCAIGAIIYSQDWEDEVSEESEKIQMEKVASYLGMVVLSKPEPVPAFNIPAWNDDEDRELQEVLDAFAKAEKIARAGYDPDAP